MKNEFEMSLMGELGFLLGLQIKQSVSEIFICQEKYRNDLIQKLNMKDAKAMSTHMHPSNNLHKDESGTFWHDKEY